MVSTKELYEKYKQLKAEGKNVSISELRAQMEEEEKKAQEPVKASTVSVSQASMIDNNQTVQVPSSNSLFNQTQSDMPLQPQTLVQSPMPGMTYSQTYSSNILTENAVKSDLQTNVNVIKEPEIKKFALIGYPLGHSLSYHIHKAGFESLGINATYEMLETPPENLVDRIKYLKSNGYSGFNVTIPHKLPITMFLDEVDASADVINAVNTVKIDPDTKSLKGYNTDEAGFRRAIPSDIEICGKIGGVLGTGGAARAAITALARMQMKEIRLFTRDIPKSKELLVYLQKTFPNVEFKIFQIDRIMNLSDINFLVNATPIGMQGYCADLSPIEENELCTLPSDAVIYDVIYNPKRTRLINLAQKHNYRTITGMDMLVYQALEAEKIWTGLTPDFKDMKISALENI